jgi:SAM-dependent methyltransferase
MNEFLTKAHRFIFFIYYKGVRFLMRYIVKLDQLDRRGRLAYIHLAGEGIEIGALHKPLSCDWRKVRVQYVDIKTIDELKNEYKEINPKDISPVDRIDNGETLATFDDESLDFVINCHMIEHTEDPISTLNNWLRVLRPGGILYLVVPDMRYNFDCRREPTDFTHLLEDHEKGPELSREAHYIEWADLVERCRPEHIQDRARQLREQKYRIHFHVWTPTNFIAFLMSYRALDPKFEIIHMEQNKDECIALMQKVKPASSSIGMDL